MKILPGWVAVSGAIAVSCLVGCTPGAESAGETAGASAIVGDGGEGGADGGSLAAAPDILDGVCLKTGVPGPVDDFEFVGGLLTVPLTNDAVSGVPVVRVPGSAFFCNLTAAYLDAAGAVARRKVARVDLDLDSPVTPDALVTKLQSVPGVHASLVAQRAADVQALVPGEAQILVTTSDAERAAPVTDPADSAGVAALAKLTDSDLGVSDSSPDLDAARAFIKDGKSSLAVDDAQKVADNLLVTLASRASAHFVAGDRVLLSDAGGTSPGIVLNVVTSFGKQHVLDPLQVLVVDGSNRLVVEKLDKAQKSVTLVAGAVPKR